jgi:hypothetical protein
VDLEVVVEVLLVEQEQPVKDLEEETKLVLEEVTIPILGVLLVEEALVVRVRTEVLTLEGELVELEFPHLLLGRL